MLRTTSLLLLLMGCHGGGEGKAALPPRGEAPAAKAEQPTGQAAAAEAAATAAPAAAPATEPVATATAKDANVEYRLTGEVSAVRKSQIGFRVAGILQSVNVKPGVAAKKGDVLAALDDRDFVLKVEMAKARLESARIAEGDAEKELKREMELKKENASTPTTFDKVKAASDQAQVGTKSAELDLKNAELALKDTKLVAPYDCVVATQLHYEGEQVQSPPPSPVFEVYDTSEPEITLTAPERLMGQVKVGSTLKVAVPSAGYSGKAEVTRLVPVISDKTRTFQVTAKFISYDQKVVAGSYAEATLD